MNKSVPGIGVQISSGWFKLRRETDSTVGCADKKIVCRLVSYSVGPMQASGAGTTPLQDLSRAYRLYYLRLYIPRLNLSRGRVYTPWKGPIEYLR